MSRRLLNRHWTWAAANHYFLFHSGRMNDWLSGWWARAKHIQWDSELEEKAQSHFFHFFFHSGATNLHTHSQVSHCRHNIRLSLSFTLSDELTRLSVGFVLGEQGKVSTSAMDIFLQFISHELFLFYAEKNPIMTICNAHSIEKVEVVVISSSID